VLRDKGERHAFGRSLEPVAAPPSPLAKLAAGFHLECHALPSAGPTSFFRVAISASSSRSRPLL
jgi:hypothetical protein